MGSRIRERRGGPTSLKTDLPWGGESVVGIPVALRSKGDESRSRHSYKWQLFVHHPLKYSSIGPIWRRRFSPFTYILVFRGWILSRRTKVFAGQHIDCFLDYALCCLAKWNAPRVGSFLVSLLGYYFPRFPRSLSVPCSKVFSLPVGNPEGVY